MNILLLYECNGSDVGIQIKNNVQNILERNRHSVHATPLDSNELKPCVACLGCWLRTPGQCLITNDSTNKIASKQVNSDAIVIISEITYGGFSADIKSFLDRSIQNILPYFVSHKGETHHPMRYRRFPIWVAIGYGEVRDAEKRTFAMLAERNALNMHPAKHLAITVRNINELESKSRDILKILEVDA